MCVCVCVRMFSIALFDGMEAVPAIQQILSPCHGQRLQQSYSVSACMSEDELSVSLATDRPVVVPNDCKYS